MLQDQITVLTFNGMATEISGAHERHTQNQQAQLKRRGIPQLFIHKEVLKTYMLGTNIE